MCKRVQALVDGRGYLAKLLKNPNVARYLERHQADIARELQDLIETIGQEHRRRVTRRPSGRERRFVVDRT